MGNSTMTFEQWLINLGKSPKTAQNYEQAIQGSISQWAIEAGLINKKISDSYTPSEFTEFASRIRNLDIFKERNTTGKGMYQAALKWFEAYLDDLTGQSVAEDIGRILVDNTLTPTEKLVYISTRVGQGSFRQKLIDYWQGCAITKYANTQLLVASHIKPWRSSNNHERLDVYNGILLLPNYDKAFDLGYISFDEEGKVCISSEIDNPQLLGIREELTVNVNAQHQLYLSYHRENIFKG